MIFYILLICLVLILSLKSDRVSYFSIYIILFMVSAFRFDVGYDYGSYHFLSSGNAPIYLINRIEYIYRMIIKISVFMKNPQFVFIITSLFYFLLLYFSIEKNKYKGQAVFFHISFFFLPSLTAQRYILSYMIVLYSYKYIIKKNFLKYLLALIVAVNIHSMAFLGIIFYFFGKIKLNAIKLLILLLSSVVFRKFALYFIGFTKYAPYLEKSNNGGTKMIYIFVIIGLILILLKEKLEKKNENNNILISIYFFSLILNIIFIDVSTAGIRLGQLGYMFLIYLIPDIFNIFKNKKTLKTFLYFVSIFHFLLVVYLGNENKSKKIYTPYRIFINKSIDDLK